MTVSTEDTQFRELMTQLRAEFPETFNTIRCKPSPAALEEIRKLHRLYDQPGMVLEGISGSFSRKPDGTWPTQAEVDDEFVAIIRESFTAWVETTFWPESRPAWRDAIYNAKRLLPQHPVHFLRHFGQFLWRWVTWREPDYLKKSIPLRPLPTTPKE